MTSLYEWFSSMTTTMWLYAGRAACAGAAGRASAPVRPTARTATLRVIRMVIPFGGATWMPGWGPPPPRRRPPDNLQLHGLVPVRVKLAVVVSRAVIFTWRLCGWDPSLATISDR